MAPASRTASIRWNDSCNFVYQSKFKGKGFHKPDHLRKFPKCGEIRDVNGQLWDVRDVRTTKHGFDLLFGTVSDDYSPGTCGLPRLIATQALWDFWDANCTKMHGFLFDLPAGRTTLKRMRKKLGFNWHDDTDDFWQERIEDLASLPVREFAAKHAVAADVVSDRRRQLVGKRARDIGWWRKPKHLKILLSDRTLSQAGRKLGIGISQTKRLRDRAKQELRLSRTARTEVEEFVGQVPD